MAAAVVAAFVVLFFGPVFTRQATFGSVENLQRYSHPWSQGRPQEERLFPQLDHANFVHPRQTFVDRSLKVDHQIPLWNPMMFGGHPFMADGGSRLAYPPLVLLSLLFDPTWTHDLYVMLHVLAAGITMFALMRELRVGPAGSLLAGVAWAFSSYSLGWIMLEMFAAPAALLPLVLLCLRRWHERDSWPAVLVGTLLLGVLLLGTSLELALISFVCVAGYAGGLALTRVVRERRELTRSRRLVVMATPGLFLLGALAIGAVVLLPFLELAGASERAARSDLPRALSVVPVGNFRWAFVPPGVPAEVFQAAYALVTRPVFVGTATAVLAIFGLFQRRPGAALGRALVVGLFLYTVGTPLTWLANHLVPSLSALRGYGRSLFLWDLGVAILGGLGLDAGLRWFGRRRADEAPSGRRWAGRVLPGCVAATCILATGIQLVVHGRHVNPPFQSRQAASLYPPTPATEAAGAVIGGPRGRARVLPVHRAGDPLPTMHGAVGMALDLPVASGYEPVVPERVSKLTRVIAGEPPTSVLSNSLPGTFFPYVGSTTVRVDLLARVGVGAVLGPPGLALDQGWAPGDAAGRGLRNVYGGSDGTVYQVDGGPPRASVVSEAVWVASSAEALERFASPTFDARQQVILEGRPSAVGGQPGPGVTPAGRVTWQDDRPNTVRLQATSPAPGWVVLLDSWDPGWRATVNGRRAEVLPANYGFRAVAIPAGSSTVSFSYRPTSVTVGAWVSALSIGLILGLLVVTCARRRRRDATDPGPA